MAVPDLQEALTQLQQKDVDAAIATLEDTVEALPAHLTAHVLLARSYEAKQKWERALRSWEQARFLLPNSPVVREGKQRVLRKMDEEDEDASAPDTLPEMESPSPPTPAEADPAPASDTDDSLPGLPDPPDADSGPSDLQDLREQAEQEARQGGARPGLSHQVEGTPSSPEEQVADFEGEGEEDADLDRLIEDLESARIEPTPDPADVPEPDLEDDVEDMVSETLGRIYESQENYKEAAEIYLKLAAQEPEQARDYLEKAASLRKKAEAEAPDPDDT